MDHQDTTSRRAFLATCGAALAGCSAPVVEKGQRSAETDTLQWPMYGYDATHTGYNPISEGPTEVSKPRWRTNTAGASVFSAPAAVDGVLFVGSGQWMYALKYRTGGEKWSRPFKTYVYPYSPAIVDGALYVVGISGHKDRTGFLYALDAGTGVTNWQVQATVTAPPTVAHGRVYYPEKTRIVARATDGTLVWSRDLNDECPYTRVASAVAAGAESLFVGMVCYKSKGQPIGDGILYALDQSGRVQWLYRTDGEIRNGVVLRDGTVYLVTHSGAVHAVDRSTGKRVWQIEVDNQIRTAPVVSPDTIYVGAYSGAVYALTATTGDIKWTTVTEIGATGLSATEDIVVVGGDSVTALYSNDGSVVWSFSSGNYSSTFGPPVIGRQAVCCGACIKNDPQDKYQNAVFAMMER